MDRPRRSYAASRFGRRPGRTSARPRTASPADRRGNPKQEPATDRTLPRESPAGQDRTGVLASGPYRRELFAAEVTGARLPLRRSPLDEASCARFMQSPAPDLGRTPWDRRTGFRLFVVKIRSGSI
jgi:hypothetical protein